MGRLTGKAAVVTGGALGLGHAICRRMAEEGAAVLVLDTLDAEGQALADALMDQGRTVAFRRCDVTLERDVAEAMAHAATRFGHLDTVVNNARIAGVNRPTHEVTEAERDRVEPVNVKGVFFGVNHAVPYLRRVGGGSIINLSSIYGLVGAADSPPHHASPRVVP